MTEERLYLQLREDVVDGSLVEIKKIFNEELGVASTRMCGFNQSELNFLIWVVVVFDQVSASFCGILG